MLPSCLLICLTGEPRAAWKHTWPNAVSKLTEHTRGIVVNAAATDSHVVRMANVDECGVIEKELGDQPRDVESILRQISDSVEQALRGEGSFPSTQMYADTLATCAQAAEWRGALRVLTLMKDAFIEPEPAHLTHAIRACGA